MTNRSQFKPGQKVLAANTITDMSGVQVPKGTVGTYSEQRYEWSAHPLGEVDFPGFTGDGHDGAVKAFDHELQAYEGPKVGDRVMYDRDPHRAHTHSVKRGDIRKVAKTTTAGHVMLVPEPGDTHGPDYTFGARDFVPANDAPHWEDVTVGDTVTFRTNQTGEEFTASVTTSPDTPTNRDPHVMGIWTGSTALNGRNTLLSIKKPQPVLPTANGSVIRRKAGYGRPTFHLINGQWTGANSGGVGVPNQWVGGWELVTDAGEDS